LIADSAFFVNRWIILLSKKQLKNQRSGGLFCFEALCNLMKRG